MPGEAPASKVTGIPAKVGLARRLLGGPAMKNSSSRRAFVMGMLALGLPASTIAQGFPDGVRDVFGPRFGAQPSLGLARLRRPGAGAGDRLRHWNEIAIYPSGLAHTPLAVGD